MNCPDCGGRNVYCYMTRQRKKWRLRRYKCADCGGRFATEERIRLPKEEGQIENNQPTKTEPPG